MSTTKGLPFHLAVEFPELGGWMRFDVAPDTVTKSHLVCLIRCVAAGAYVVLRSGGPAVDRSIGAFTSPNLSTAFVATISWDTWLASTFFRDGYGSSAADIWAPDGRLLAKSYQTFVIYG